MINFKKLKWLISKSLFFTAALVSLFLVLEITLRIVYSFKPDLYLIDRSYNRFRGKPGSFNHQFMLNTLGFHDTEYPVEKRNGTTRIVAVGDSTFFSVVPYENNSLTLTEQFLKQKDPACEIINMGIPSISPRDIFSLFIHEGIRFSPDIVLVSVFVGDDISFSPLKRMLSYSRAYDMIRFVFDKNRRFEGRQIHGKVIYDNNAPTFSHGAYLEILKPRMRLFLQPASGLKKYADSSFVPLLHLKKICDQKKIRMIAVICPEELQLNATLRKETAKLLESKPEKYDFNIPNRFLKSFFDQNGIEFVDLLPYFAEEIDKKQAVLFKPDDSHWNVKGNELVARILSRHLFQKKQAGY